MSGKRGKPMSEAAFRRLWMDRNVPAQDIADLLDVSIQALRFRALARGLPLRKGGGGMNRKVDPALMRAMWDFNVSPTEIARYFGVHPTTITKRSIEWGFPARNCTRWNSMSVAGFLLAQAAREEQAALRLAEMVDGFRRAA